MRRGLPSVSALLVVSLLLGGSATITLGQRDPTGDGVVYRRLTAGPPRGPIPAGPGKIRGVVIDRESGAPIAGVRIVITLLGARSPANPNLRAPGGGLDLITDGEGRFLAEGLSLGDYGVNPDPEGYANPRGPTQIPIGGQSIQLTTTHPWLDLTFRFSRLGALSGVVRDDSGQPISDVGVRLLRRLGIGARAEWQPIPAVATTDAQGGYRFVDVPAGEYIVCAYFRRTTIARSVADAYRQALQPGGDQSLIDRLQASGAPVPMPAPAAGLTLGLDYLRIDDARDQPLAELNRDGVRARLLRTTCAPSAAVLDDATHVTLAAGEVRRDVNLRVAAETGVRVSGQLIGLPEDVAYVGLRLRRESGDAIMRTLNSDDAATVSDAAGRFMFLRVPQGRYALEATILRSEPLPARSGGAAPATPPRRVLRGWVRRPVVVGTDDLDGLSTRVEPGLWIRGRVEFDGLPPRPRPVVNLSATPSHSSGYVAPPPVLAPDLSFSYGPLLPGSYVVSAVNTSAVMLHAVAAGGRDALDRPIGVVDRDVTDVVLTMSARLSCAIGIVRDAAGAPVPAAHVLVFPADYRAWLARGANPFPTRSLRTSESGAFQFTGLPTGDYLIAAFADDPAGDWPDPDLVGHVASAAMKIRVEEGVTIQWDLKLAALPH